MASNAAAYNGSLGGDFRLNIESHEISVDTANNRSLVELTLYMSCVTSAGNVYNNVGNPWSITGDISASGNITYDFTAAGQSTYMINAGQYYVSHNSDGTKTLSLTASHDAQNSPYLTTSSVGLSYALTTINRTANITSFTASNVSDVGFTINVAADQTCSQIQYSLDGGSTYTTIAGSATSWAIPVSGLKSGTTYTLKVIVTDAASGLTTTSGTITATTNIQNNFAAMGVF